MDKEQMISCCRHDMLVITMRGRERIFQTILKEHSDRPINILEELMFHEYPKSLVPGIVRRSDTSLHDSVAVGFVHPQLYNDSRVRISAEVRANEIIDVITPYALPHFAYAPRTKVIQALCDATALFTCKTGKLGVVGSVAMEIITGAPYTNDTSDLDLLIRDCSLNEITEAYTAITQIGKRYNINVDIEIALKNGYGIKAAELFIGSYTLLGKSLTDVQLLKRNEVLDSLKFEEE